MQTSSTDSINVNGTNVDATNINATKATTQSDNTANVKSSVQHQTLNSIAKKVLSYSSIFWFVVMLLGQWFFFYYIMSFYGFSVINDNMEIWNRWEPMGSTPYHANDFVGNFAFAAHAIGAGIVAFGGALQLLPQVRNRFPKFHKMNGYVFLLTVLGLAISGLYLVWIRDTNPIKLSGIGTTINGTLILIFAFFTVKTAIKKDIKNHRKWALQLFLVSNAQWILRIGVFGYLVSGSALGLEPSFKDAFFPMWTFGCFVIPLAMLHLYFYAQSHNKSGIKLITGSLLIVLTLLMLIGMVGFTPFLLSVMSEGPIGL